MDSVDVSRHLSKVLILSILDFTIGFEIDHGPAIEVRSVLLKSKVDNAVDEGPTHIAGAPLSFFGLSATMASVVISSPANDAAF